MRWANHETPKTRVPRIELIMTKVRRAFTSSGTLKSATPSEIASSPVREDPPFAKARNKMKIALKVRSPCASPIATAPSVFVARTGKSPLNARTSPVINTTAIAAMKK
ncbi:unannotated protein [freshwater metagenome]|uniref:Unannotated protein n=1 Tax=freshwater metagenome TaxID=449393 RepID=A0A6J7BL63_9ZZZZ